MDWDLILKFVSYLGTFVSGGWLINLYKAKPERTNMELANVHKAMEIQSKLIASQDKRIDGLCREVATLHKRVDIKHEVIYSAYGCRLFSTPDECIVIKQYNEKCLECSLNEAVNPESHDDI